MTDIDDKLLEQQEQEQKEQNNVGPKFEAGSNGHDKEESITPIADEEIRRHEEDDGEKEKNKEEALEIDPSIDLNPYILDKDYADYVIDTAKKTVKREDTLIRQIVYT